MDVVSPAPRGLWRELLAEAPDAVVYQTPEWLDACCAAGGYHDRSRLYRTHDGRLLLLPLVSRSARSGATAWSLPPGWGQAGLLAAGPVPAAEVAAVAADLRRHHLTTVVKPGTFAGSTWSDVPARERRPHRVHVVDLRDGFDHYWNARLPSGTRSKVRRATRAGVTVDWDDTGRNVPIAWDLYLRWSVRRGAAAGLPARTAVARAERQESWLQFRTVAASLGDRCLTGIARVDGEPLAAMTMLVRGRHAHYWRGFSDHAGTRGRYPNQLLMTRLVERAAAAGCTTVHLGESAGTRTLEEFKESLGGDPDRYEDLRFSGWLGAATERLDGTCRHVAGRGRAGLRRVRTAVLAANGTTGSPANGTTGSATGDGPGSAVPAATPGAGAAG